MTARRRYAKRRRRRIRLYPVATEAAGPLGREQAVPVHSSDADQGGKLHFNRLQRTAACVSVHGMAHTALENREPAEPGPRHLQKSSLLRRAGK